LALDFRKGVSRERGKKGPVCNSRVVRRGEKKSTGGGKKGRELSHTEEGGGGYEV